MKLGPSRVRESPTQEDQNEGDEQKFRKIWEKIIKWGKLEDMFMSCPPRFESLATSIARPLLPNMHDMDSS